MKTTSKIFYTIGKIFNIIGIVVTALCLIGGIVVLALAPQISANVDGEYSTLAIRTLGIGLIIGCAIGLAIEIVVLCVANYASKALENGKRDNVPHITIIVIGVIAGDIFYLIAGICGLIEENTQPKVE